MRERRRPSPTTVIACLALFFAVAGGSAIALQGRNSVDSGDIKRLAVKVSDIANNAVTTRKIRKNHVRASDVQNDAIGTGELRDGQVRVADLAPAEPMRLLGAVGQPSFGNGGQEDCRLAEDLRTRGRFLRRPRLLQGPLWSRASHRRRDQQQQLRRRRDMRRR